MVTYDNGRLTKVVTRGNGHTGTNITHLAPAIAGILPEIADKGHVVVRGEAVISYQDFEIFNMENDEAYANPRNLASGSLTLKDINEVRRRHIQWIAFTLVHADEAPQSWGARMDLLAAWGFTTGERQLVEHPTEEAINDMVEDVYKRQHQARHIVVDDVGIGFHRRVEDVGVDIRCLPRLVHLNGDVFNEVGIEFIDRQFELQF